MGSRGRLPHVIREGHATVFPHVVRQNESRARTPADLPPTRSLRDEWGTRTDATGQSAAVRRRLTASAK
jgi:hypothetical protein